MIWFRRSTVLAAVILAIVASSALAQDAGRVRQIVVQGTQRIEVETVKSYMALAEGDPFDAERLDRSLKTLFNTGLFSDVTIRQEGDSLVVRVVENPIINRLAFEGAKRIKEEQLQSEVQLRPRVVYTRTKVLADVKRILDLYKREGRFAATVDPKIIQLPQNRVDLVFEINEGPPTYVKRINFVGNHFYSEDNLREVMLTKEERWYRFLTSDDTYDPDRLAYDRELLRRYYLKHGFADFKVTSAVAELTPDREGFFITITLDEGERYQVGVSDIKSTLKDVKLDELRKVVTAEPGDWYNGDEVENVVQKLTDKLGTQGFAFVDVRPEVKRNREELTVDVVYNIQEGPRVFVDRIDIGGNVRTLDKVIRREFTLVEGDAFNSAKLRRSKERVNELNFFQKVDVVNVPSDVAPDRTVIKVDVVEKSTGELSFGVGWSSMGGPLAEASIRERNLLGRGQELGLTGGLGTQQTNLQLSFTEPYFLDRRLTAGFDIFDIDHKLQETAGYNSNSLGLSLRTGYLLTENVSQSWRYMLKRDEVKDVASGASVFIKEQEGVSVLSSIQHAIFYDRRDSRIDPTEGYLLRMSNEFTGLGGDQMFLRNSAGAVNFYPLAEQVIFSLSGNVGVITSLNNRAVRVTERYFLGGNTLRGFANFGVSPRDHATGSPLGGLWQYFGSGVISFPLGLPSEFGVGGRIFTDYGAVGPTDKTASVTNIDQASGPRITAGMGVTWKSPMGPVAMDIAYPLKKEPVDKTQIFHFSFGTRF
jgi:outer membrane protein insertion porin family